MARYDFKSPRLYVEAALADGAAVALEKPQAHYLTNVLRLKAGDTVLAFNGKDGEWRAELSVSGKKASLALQERAREQPEPRDLHYLFAPLKHERLDYMMQKAVEMGATRLVPVLTQHTQVNRVNTETGTWTGNVLYMPDGSELFFEKGMTVEFEVSAPGYLNTRISYVVRKRRNSVDVPLARMAIDMSAEDPDDITIQFGRDKPID